MLFQLHRQNIDDITITEFVDQVAMPEQENHDTLREWVNQVKERHELGERETWLLCDERSKYFKFGRVEGLPELTEGERAAMNSLPDNLVEVLWNEAETKQ